LIYTRASSNIYHGRQLGEKKKAAFAINCEWRGDSRATADAGTAFPNQIIEIIFPPGGCGRKIDECEAKFLPSAGRARAAKRLQSHF